MFIPAIVFVGAGGDRGFPGVTRLISVTGSKGQKGLAKLCVGCIKLYCSQPSIRCNYKLSNLRLV